jgi:hypothetical protein
VCVCMCIGESENDIERERLIQEIHSTVTSDLRPDKLSNSKQQLCRPEALRVIGGRICFP